MTWINDLWNNLIGGQTFRPQAIAATTNGLAVDLSETDLQVYLEINAGVVTDGGYTFTVEESETSGGVFTAVVLSDGAIPEFTSSVDDRRVTRRFKRTKRFVRSVCTESTAGATGGLFAANFFAQKKAN